MLNFPQMKGLAFFCNIGYAMCKVLAQHERHAVGARLQKGHMALVQSVPDQ